MSIPVTTDDLATNLEEYGAACFLLSVPPGGGHPKVAHVPRTRHAGLPRTHARLAFDAPGRNGPGGR